MRNFIWAILGALVLSGCGPSGVRQRGETAIPAGRAAVTDMRVSVNDKSMIVTWKRVGQGTISGYNIYISKRPLAALYPGVFIDSSISPHNPVPFPGDTNPEDGVESYEATQLENGVRYYVTVRAVSPDGSLSVPSTEATAVCGPRGEIELPVRYQSSPDGYSFEKNAYTDANSVDNDLFFFSRDGNAYLSSPRRLDGFINDTRFLVLPFKGSLDEVAARLAELSPQVNEDRVRVVVGDWVLARCERGSSALLEVKAIKGTDQETRVVLFFAYSTVRDELLF